MKKVGKNYLYNIIYQILILLIPLITTPYISRVLSVEGIGLYSYTYSIAYFLTIVAELGTVTYARREIAFCQDDIKKRSTIFFEITIFRAVMAFISLFIYMIYAINSSNVIIALFQIFYIIAVIFDVTWFFQGMEDFKTVVIKNSFVKIVMLVFIFVFVKNESDLGKYVLGLSFLPIIGNIITWPTLKKYITKVPIKSLKPFRHFKDTFILFIPNIASQVYLLLDKTMLGILTINNIENGYYEQAQKIIRMCWTFLTTFSAVMTPRIAYYIGKKDIEQIKKYMQYSFSFVWVISIAMCFGLIGISDNLVPWFFGENYQKVSSLLKIFSLILIPIGINGVTGTQYLVCNNKEKIYTISIVVGAIINFLLNLILIKKFYSIGAAISSVFAEYIIALIQVIYIYKLKKDITLKDMFKESYKCLIAGIIMLITLIFLNSIFAPSLINTFIMIICGAFVYFIVLILLKNKFVCDNYLKVKKFIKR